jgi:hypothetical protein
MLEAMSEAIAGTSASIYIADHLWMTPAVQSVHILAIAGLSGSVLMLGGRLTRIAGAELPLTAVDRRFSRWIWWSALLLLVSGILLIVGEPARELMNILFRVKMLLVLALLALVWIFQRGVRGKRDVAWVGASGVALGTGMGLLWFAIVAAGRWIAYI